MRISLLKALIGCFFLSLLSCEKESKANYPYIFQFDGIRHTDVSFNFYYDNINGFVLAHNYQDQNYYEKFNFEGYEFIRPETLKFDFGIRKMSMIDDKNIVFEYQDPSVPNDTLQYKFEGIKISIIGFKVEPFILLGVKTLFYDVMFYKVRKKSGSTTIDSDVTPYFAKTGNAITSSYFLVDSLNLVPGDTLIFVYDKFVFSPIK